MRSRHILFPVLFVVLFFLTGHHHCCGFDTITPGEEKELARTWEMFLRAVTTKDFKKLRNLSAGRIRCPSCADNTAQEEKEIEKLQASDTDWYRLFYAERVYIPLDRFVAEDFPLVFTRSVVTGLRERAPAYGAEECDGHRVYEAVIAASGPNGSLPGDEGSLHLFQFIKTGRGLKFWGIDTIP